MSYKLRNYLYKLANTILGIMMAGGAAGAIAYHTGHLPFTPDLVYLVAGACQIYDNRRLEKREQQSKSQQGGGIAVDLSLMEEKKALISGKGFFASTIFSRIKTIYFIWLAIDIVFPGNPVQIAQSMALLSAQYFREVHYTPPNETSRVAAFIHSLVPRPVATKEYGT